jgi:hypothetical protein
MAVFRTILLSVLVVFIAATVLVGQLAFRADQTVLRHSFAHEAIEAWLAPLQDAANHEEFVADAWSQMRRALGWSIPVQIQSVIEDAALQSFRPDWITDVVKRMHTAIYLFMRGREPEISLVVPLGDFKRAISTISRDRLDARAAASVSSEIGRLPSSIDLWRAVPDETRASVELWIRRIPVISILLQYLVPGLFLGLTLLPGRPGSALVASGAGLAAGGLSMIALVGFAAQGIASRLAAGIRQILPGRPTWVYSPAVDTFAAALRSGRGFAWFLVVLGVLIAGLGVLVIRRWNDSYSFVSSATRTVRETLRDQ